MPNTPNPLDTYDQLKSMAVGFALRPGDRLNESALAKQLGISRTPLREALNRLVAEGFVDTRRGEGFFCRGLNAKDAHDLYGLRVALEVEAVERACELASQADLEALDAWLNSEGLDVRGLTVAEACARDEVFHIKIAELSGNAQIAAQLQGVNEKIRYLRWVQLNEDRLRLTKNGHLRVMQALLARDGEEAKKAMRDHISLRNDQIVDAIDKGIAHIYTNRTDDLMAHVIEQEDAA